MDWHLDKAILDFGLTDDYLIIMDWNDGRRSAFDPRPYFTGDSMAELANPRLFETAYLLGHGRGIGWSGNRDLGVGLLYEKSATVDDRAKPLPPRGSSMTWMPNRRIESIRACVEDGTLLVRWNDETARLFSTWDHATNGSVDKLVDASYLASARITPEHDGVEWPDGERISAKTLYERSPIIDAEYAI